MREKGTWKLVIEPGVQILCSAHNVVFPIPSPEFGRGDLRHCQVMVRKQTWDQKLTEIPRNREHPP